VARKELFYIFMALLPGSGIRHPASGCKTCLFARHESKWKLGFIGPMILHFKPIAGQSRNQAVYFR
jgi:hypothetical protein